MAKKKAAKAKKAKKTVKKAVSKKKSAKKAVRTVKKSAVKGKAVAKKQAKQFQKPTMEAPATKLIGKANLLVTYDPNHKGTAMQELRDAFKLIGEKAEIADSGVEGLFKLSVPDARRATIKLSAVCRKNPSAFVATHHYIPVDRWCKSEISDMQAAIKSLLSNIGNNEKWKMSLAKRHWDKMGGVELILKLTEVIDRPKVDLNNPQKIVQVEIIGNDAGISVLKPEDILDVPRLKAER